MGGMDLHVATTFNADAPAVRRLLLNQRFWEDVCRAVGAIEHSVSVSDFEVRISRTFPSPSQVARFVGDTMTMDEVMNWESDAATHRATVTGMPVTYKGDITLAGHFGATTATYHGIVKVAIPLLGATLEEQAMPLVTESFRVTEQVAARYLGPSPE
jgi:hypothetical protein